jgi:hypothetical protein
MALPGRAGTCPLGALIAKATTERSGLTASVACILGMAPA